jgi:hypothetical protein
MNPIVAEAIDQREKGQIPISIATALALEGAFGIYPDRPESPAPITGNVKQLWINLRTLIRNFYGSVKSDRKILITPPYAANALIEEINIIESAVHQYSNGQVSVVFYYCNYEEVVRKFPKANVKSISTENQKIQHTLEVQTLQFILQQEPNCDIRKMGLDFGNNHPSSLILTHYPIDLLNRYGFQRLDLLESHTGVIKPPSQWHTKLTGGKELDFLPFCKFTLQVFGDGGNLFSPQSSSVKNKVIELAKQDRWTTVTTREKMQMSLNKISHPADRMVLLSML